MKLTRHAIGIVTARLAASRDFYTRHFGFQVVFENDWYIHLRQPSDGFEIGLVQPEHPTQPPVFRAAFAGGGIWMNLEVEDVDAEYARIQAAGLPVAVTLRDEPWGERHFTVTDPNGVAVNVSFMAQQPEPLAAATA